MAPREAAPETGRAVLRPRRRPMRARVPSAAAESSATTASGARATTVKAANVPRLVVPPGAWSRIDVACAAPSASSRVACSQAATPPGWEKTIGTNQTATAATPAATVNRRSRQRRVEAATAMHASSANDWMIDGRKPARIPRATTAATPWQAAGTSPPGEDQQRCAGQEVEGVGGNDRPAEPCERRGGDHHSCRQADPPPAQVAARDHGESGSGRGRQRGQEDQRVDHPGTRGLVDEAADGDVEPVPGRLGEPVGHVEVADGRGVLGRVPVGRAPCSRGQPGDQGGRAHQPRGDAVDHESVRSGTPGGGMASLSHDPILCRHGGPWASERYAAAGHGRGGRVEDHGSGYRAVAPAPGYGPARRIGGGVQFRPSRADTHSTGESRVAGVPRPVGASGDRGCRANDHEPENVHGDEGGP